MSGAGLDRARLPYPGGNEPGRTQHCVTATVEDAAGNLTPELVVRFQVGGANTAGGSATTNVNGEQHPRPDRTVRDRSQDLGTGDRASFGGNAKADADDNVTGTGSARITGPYSLQPQGNVLVAVCGADGKSATHFGEATITVTARRSTGSTCAISASRAGAPTPPACSEVPTTPATKSRRSNCSPGEPSRTLGLVQEWATVHRAELAANWAKAEAHLPLDTIEPVP